MKELKSYHAGERTIPESIDSQRNRNNIELLRQEALSKISCSAERREVSLLIGRILDTKK